MADLPNFEASQLAWLYLATTLGPFPDVGQHCSASKGVMNTDTHQFASGHGYDPGEASHVTKAGYKQMAIGHVWV